MEEKKKPSRSKAAPSKQKAKKAAAPKAPKPKAPKPAKKAASKPASKATSKAASTIRTGLKKALGTVKQAAKEAARAVERRAGASPKKPAPRKARPAVDERPGPETGAGPMPSGPTGAGQEESPADALVEGFFVARIAGEQTAREHHLTEDAVSDFPSFDEQLADLPISYEDDSVILLARDPTTLFVLWDIDEAQLEEARRDLKSSRALLRVLEGGRLLREVDAALSSRSAYLHHLPAGRTYQVELCLVGRDGTTRRLGRLSNPMALPWIGAPSEGEGGEGGHSVRFLKLPWSVPLTDLHQFLKTESAPLEVVEGDQALAIWRRVGLPSSAEWIERRQGMGKEGAAPAGGRPSSFSGRPSPSKT